MIDARPGRFVWYELMTTDPAAAMAFYGHVAGWTTQKWQGADYTMWVGPQGPLGGVMALPEAAKQMGAPPHWIGNLEVADVDAAAAKLQAAGGRVLVPVQEMPTVGRFVVCSDPQGATITLFQPAGNMDDRDRNKAGEIGWHELITENHETAFEFYRDLVGWEKLSEMDMGPMGKYLLYGRDGKQVGGMMTKPAGMPMPSAWLYYINVPEIDSALERAKSKEARLLMGPQQIPGGGWIAQLMDPQGAAFALVAPPRSAQ